MSLKCDFLTYSWMAVLAIEGFGRERWGDFVTAISRSRRRPRLCLRTSSLEARGRVDRFYSFVNSLSMHTRQTHWTNTQSARKTCTAGVRYATHTIPKCSSGSNRATKPAEEYAEDTAGRGTRVFYWRSRFSEESDRS